MKRLSLSASRPGSLEPGNGGSAQGVQQNIRSGPSGTPSRQVRPEQSTPPNRSVEYHLTRAEQGIRQAIIHIDQIPDVGISTPDVRVQVQALRRIANQAQETLAAYNDARRRQSDLERTPYAPTYPGSAPGYAPGDPPTTHRHVIPPFPRIRIPPNHRDPQPQQTSVPSTAAGPGGTEHDSNQSQQPPSAPSENARPNFQVPQRQAREFWEALGNSPWELRYQPVRENYFRSERERNRDSGGEARPPPTLRGLPTVAGSSGTQPRSSRTVPPSVAGSNGSFRFAVPSTATGSRFTFRTSRTLRAASSRNPRAAAFVPSMTPASGTRQQALNPDSRNSTNPNPNNTPPWGPGPGTTQNRDAGWYEPRNRVVPRNNPDIAFPFV